MAPDDTTVTSDSSATVAINPTRGIDAVKTSELELDEDNRADVGDTIDYTFDVTNTGAVTLNRLAVDDPRTGPVSCPVATLAPGASTTCTAQLTITQDEVDAGRVDNVATASGIIFPSWITRAARARSESSVAMMRRRMPSGF